MLRVKELHDKIASQAADLAKWNKTLEERVADQVSQIERAEPPQALSCATGCRTRSQ
jgi:K+-transporting ATPase c subunit